MKSKRKGNEICRIKSPRNITVPVSSETITISRPLKSRSISRDIRRMRRASCSSVMRMRSISLRQRGGTLRRALWERETAVFRIGLSIGIASGLPRHFLAKLSFWKPRANRDSLQQCLDIIKTKLRPRFHLLASRRQFLKRKKLELRDDLFVFLNLLRCAEQHMHYAKVNSTDFGGIIVDQANGSRVECTLNGKLFAHLSLDRFLKRLQADGKERMIFVIDVAANANGPFRNQTLLPSLLAANIMKNPLSVSDHHVRDDLFEVWICFSFGTGHETVVFDIENGL